MVDRSVHLSLMDFNGDPWGDKVSFAAGSYRARFSAKNFVDDEISTAEIDDLNDSAQDYELIIWPSPPQPDTVLKTTGSLARHYHSALSFEIRSMASLWTRLDIHMQAHAKGMMAHLRPPASEAQIAAAEDELGIDFPEDLRAAYRWHDGQTYYDGQVHPYFFGDRAWASLEHVLRCWRSNNKALDLLDANAVQDEGTIVATQVIRYDWWNAGYIPIGDPQAATKLCIDMAPGPAGRPGQVIAWFADGPEHVVIAGSLHEHMEDLARRLESGAIRFSGELNGWVESATDRPISHGGRWQPNPYL